ncbi:MAG TPA: hypothetical protein VG944_23105 [Fimbriimonas sp.]|nr:hypothetical protein [Fimbriimonas sp.]
MSSQAKFLAFVVASALAGSAAASPGHRATHRITAKQAAKIALNRCHGKLLKKPRLEREDGQWQYEVLIRRGRKLKEVNVVAATGRISNVETTSVGEEESEARAEKRHKK